MEERWMNRGWRGVEEEEGLQKETDLEDLEV